MPELPLQLLSLLLIIAGLLFLAMEVYVGFDRAFLFLGGALVLFGTIPAIDIWVLPVCTSSAGALLWIRIQHVLTVALLPLVLWYLKNFLKSDIRYLHLLVNVFVVFFSVLLFSDASLRIENGVVERGPLYKLLFLPCFAATGCFVSILIATRLRGTQGNERRILFYHLIGFSLLCAFGIIDLLAKSISAKTGMGFNSFFILGVFAFGLMTFLIFTERLIILVSERTKAYEQLRTALAEMEEASTLRQIGESAAIINHEIKNYLVRIAGAAELLQLTENLSADGKEEIDAIKKTVNDLQHFSMDILHLSRAKIIKEKEMLAIVPLLRQCIDSYFAAERDRFVFACTNESQTVRGEWEKLQHVFVNIFRNAFEAEATKIEVSIISSGPVVLIAINDNGVGFPPEQIPLMFKAFYTTKKGRQGTGLGMSISRAVIESHGGHISAYSLNELGNGRHGMKIAITLPHYDHSGKNGGASPKDIALFREGIQDISTLLQVFNNIGVYPAIIHRPEEFERKGECSIKMLIAAETIIDRLMRHRSVCASRILPVSFKNGMIYVRDGHQSEPQQVFCEEFIVNSMAIAG